ncbi:MAG TPA: DUF4097 family beta strand repeat-containing protein, partial [Vicinamibacterales bacterium]|nr:DUF4097 family beta strand repeat-containing protein [Vicinamibacterales bacterium]
DADARQGLAGVTVHLAERGRRVTVEATHERVRNPPYAVTVSYAVTAPAATSVTIQSLTGHVEASGITGELSVDTTTGDVEIRDAPRLSRARTVTGSIDLTNVAHDSALEAGTIAGPVTATGIRTRRLRLDTVTGGITARDATADRVEIFTTQGSLTYDGAVAADGRYEMRTHSGSIRFIARSGSGFELRAQTFSGQIETARELGLTLVSRSRRELVGSVGDGRAVVLLTTFSGQVSVGRQ